MTNIRPLQVRKVPWPWKNAITPTGQVVTVEHYAHEDRDFPTSLVKYFDWERFEIKPRLDMGLYPDLCTCDMRSILTTARRGYGDERLYELLLAGVDPFKRVFKLFVEWAAQLLSVAPWIDAFVVGDDLAHKDNLFYPPEYTFRVLDYQRELVRLAKFASKFTVFHSDGKLPLDIKPYLDDFDRVIIQADLNPDLKPDAEILDHTHGAIFDKVSYDVKESDSHP